MKKHKIVKVYWRDISRIYSDDEWGAWFTKKHLEKMGAKFYSQECTTVGEITIDTKEFIIVSATKSDDEETPLFSDNVMIPKSVIIKIEKLN